MESHSHSSPRHDVTRGNFFRINTTLEALFLQAKQYIPREEEFQIIHSSWISHQVKDHVTVLSRSAAAET